MGTLGRHRLRWVSCEQQVTCGLGTRVAQGGRDRLSILSMSGNTVEGQGGPGHSAGLPWSEESVPEAPESVLPTLCLCCLGVGVGRHCVYCQQRWLLLLLWLLAVSFSCLSFSPHSRTAAGKVGQECLGQSSEVPALLCPGADAPES